MPRSLSAAARRAIFAPQTGEAFVVLLTLSHAFLPVPIRVGSAGEDVVSRGNTYQAFPFSATMPAEQDSAPPEVQLRIDNVDRQIVQAVRGITGAPIQVVLEVVLASTPDVVEAGPFEFSLRDISYDALVVEGSLRYEDLLNEPYPADDFTPARTPGIF